jgi:chromosome partition protein MukE
VSDRDLAKALEPRRRRFDDERVVHEIIRKRFAEAVRRLTSLGFLESVDEEHVRLRSPLLRFAESVRGIDDSGAALERLIVSGQAVASGPPDAVAERELNDDSDTPEDADEDMEVEP